jgi:protein PhnA
MNVRDSHGTQLIEGDSVMVIKDLKVKGYSDILKRGRIFKSIQVLDDDEEHVECREGKSTLVLKVCLLNLDFPLGGFSHGKFGHNPLKTRKFCVSTNNRFLHLDVPGGAVVIAQQKRRFLRASIRSYRSGSPNPKFPFGNFGLKKI